MMKYSILLNFSLIYLFIPITESKIINRNFCDTKICTKDDMTAEVCRKQGGSLVHLDGLQYCYKNITNIPSNCNNQRSFCANLGREWSKSIVAEFCHRPHGELLKNLSSIDGSFWTNIRADDQTSLWTNSENTKSLFQQGCYGDSSIVNDLEKRSPLLSLYINSKSCSDICSKYPVSKDGKGYLYSGIQFNGVINLCYCGNSFGSYGTSADKCSVTCRDGSNCGGNDFNFIYSNYATSCKELKWRKNQPFHNSIKSCAFAKENDDLSLSDTNCVCGDKKAFVCKNSTGLYYHDTPVDWYEANSICLSNNSKLPSFINCEEKAEVKNVLPSNAEIWIDAVKQKWKCECQSNYYVGGQCEWDVCQPEIDNFKKCVILENGKCRTAECTELNNILCLVEICDPESLICSYQRTKKDQRSNYFQTAIALIVLLTVLAISSTILFVLYYRAARGLWNWKFLLKLTRKLGDSQIPSIQINNPKVEEEEEEEEERGGEGGGEGGTEVGKEKES